MANYYVALTDYGKSFIANAQANTQLALTHVVLGDANNQPYLPESRLNQTKLVHQTAKLPVASVKVVNSTTAEVSAVVPSNVGGWNLHEVGITDSSGKLVYVGNFHGGYRPTLTEGAGGDMELVITIKADNLATVVIEMDSNVVGATRDWVKENFALKSLVQGLADIIELLKEDLMSTQFVLLLQRIDAIDELINNITDGTIETIKVGDTYTTTIDHANSEAVALHHGYGAWERLAEGRTLVGLSKKSSDPADYKTIGNEFGENEHTLTIDETPEHKHSKNDIFNKFTGKPAEVTTEFLVSPNEGRTVTQSDNISMEGNAFVSGMNSAAWDAMTEQEVGGNQPHNNIQPSTVVAHWVRVA